MKQATFLLSLLFMVVFAFSACEKDDDETTDDDNNNPENGNGWQTEVVDSIAGTDTGFFNMLALDSDSGVHIAYVVDGNHLKYAYKPYNGTSWNLEVVAENIEEEVDIAIDNQDRIYIAYNSAEERLMIAEKHLGDANFTHRQVADDHLLRYPSITCDHSGLLHISFQRANYGMRHAVHEFGSDIFDMEIVGNDDDVLGSRSAIVAKDDGSVHILWHDNDAIKYAEKPSATDDFTVSEIATGEYSGAYEDVGLCADRYGDLHGYYLNGQTDNNIVYIHKTSQWFTESIGNERADRIDRGIATDTLGIPYIVYSINELQIAGKPSSWVMSTIEGSYEYQCGYNTDIVITDQNAAHVSYYVVSTDVLKYAWKRL